MSISEREQQVLDSIEDDLVCSGPELAKKLAVFTRLTAGEAMPSRESVSRPVSAPAAGLAKIGASCAASRRRRWFGSRTRWRLLLLVLTIALLTLVFTVSRGTGNGICAVQWAAACQQSHVPVPAPGRPGAGVASVPLRRLPGGTESAAAAAMNADHW